MGVRTRQGLLLVVGLLSASLVGAVAASPQAIAAEPRIVTIQKLATVGLAQLEAEKVVEVCARPEQLAGKSVEFTVDVDMELEMGGAGPTTGGAGYRIGPIQFPSSFSEAICFSNLDVRIDLGAANAAEAIDIDGLQAKLDELKAIVGSIPVTELEPFHGITQTEFIQYLIDSGGLLPEFIITLDYSISAVGEPNPLESDKATLQNTNPRPIDLQAPSGEIATLRPSFEWGIPDAPPDVGPLTAVLTVVDLELFAASPNHPEASWSRTFTFNPSQYGRRVTIPYPTGAPSLKPGRSYLQRVLLTDPAGWPVGVGAADQGEEAGFSVRVDPLQPAGPAEGAILYTLTPELSWSDPNPTGVKAGIAGYQVLLSDREDLGGAWVIDARTGTTLRYSDPSHPLELGGTYFWAVEGYDASRAPLEGTRSGVQSFTIAEIGEPAILSPSDGAQLSAAQPVPLEVLVQPEEWGSELSVQWYEGATPVGSGPSLTRSFLPGPHRVRAEVYHPDRPLQRETAEVAFEVYPLLGTPVLSGLKAQYALWEPVTASLVWSGGLGPFQIEAAVEAAGQAQAGPLPSLSLEAASAGTPVSLELGTLPAGEYRLRASVQDAAGNQAVAGAASLRVEAPPIQVQLTTGGAPRTTFVLGETIELGGVVGGLLPFEQAPYRWRWLIDGNSVSEEPTVTLAAHELEVGAHTVRAEALFGDPEQVVAADERTFYVSAVDLAASVSASPSEALVGEPIQVTASFSAAGSGPYRVALWVDGSEREARGDVAQGPVEFLLQDLAPGTHNVHVVVDDQAGNGSAAPAASVQVRSPSLGPVRFVDPEGLVRTSAGLAEELALRVLVDGQDLEAFLSAHPAYAARVEIRGSEGSRELAAPYAFTASQVASEGSQLEAQVVLLVQQAEVARGTGSLEVVVEAVAVGLELLEGASRELAAGAAEASIPIRISIGSAGSFSVAIWVQTAPGPGEPAGPASVRAQQSVAVQQAPASVDLTLALGLGHHEIWAQVTRSPGEPGAPGPFDSGRATVDVVRPVVGEEAVRILSPAPTDPPSQYQAGAPIHFEATATNAYGDDLSGQLIWEAGGQEIGRGATFSRSDLPPALHTVTAFFEEAGNRVSDTVRFQVYDLQEPAIAQLIALNPAAGSVVLLASEGDPAGQPLAEGAFLLAGAILRVDPPARGAGGVAGRLLFVEEARLVDLSPGGVTTGLPVGGMAELQSGRRYRVESFDEAEPGAWPAGGEG